MNGDSTKSEIADAQTYFSIQTHRMEAFDKLTESEKRAELRERVTDANKQLASTAKKSGVRRYPFFQAAGYRGLYNMGLSEIMEKKKIPANEKLLDCVGRKELAANELRITQTEEKLITDKINNEKHAIDTHYDVGSKVRSAISRVGGIPLENLPSEPSIKKLLKKRKETKELVSKN